jgi:sugar phosphate isomerase/epimerase
MKQGRNSLGKVPRRQVLLGTAAAIGASATWQTAQAGAGSRELKNTQISLAAYSRRQSLTGGSMDLFQFIDWCAELDIPGAELTSYYFKEGFDGAYLRELRRHAFKNGVTISGTAIRNNFCLPPGPERDKEVAHVVQWVDHAAELFAPHVRIFAGDVPQGADKASAIQWVADGIKSALDHAARRGIFLGLENHGGITARAADHLAICKKVGDHPWFGINLDTGNYRTDAYEELAMAAPLSVNVQVKAAVVRNDGSKEPADLARLRKILADAGYKGWLVLEYEEQDPESEIPRWIERMKKAFG